MKCPICKKEVAPGDPEFPFCSERCREVDLGIWASEGYVIPGPPVVDAPQESEDNDKD